MTQPKCQYSGLALKECLSWLCDCERSLPNGPADVIVRTVSRPRPVDLPADLAALGLTADEIAAMSST
jgi:hypothetical protein